MLAPLRPQGRPRYRAPLRPAKQLGSPKASPQTTACPPLANPESRPTLAIRCFPPSLVCGPGLAALPAPFDGRSQPRYCRRQALRAGDPPGPSGLLESGPPNHRLALVPVCRFPQLLLLSFARRPYAVGRYPPLLRCLLAVCSNPSGQGKNRARSPVLAKTLSGPAGSRRHYHLGRSQSIPGCPAPPPQHDGKTPRDPLHSSGRLEPGQKRKSLGLATRSRLSVVALRLQPAHPHPCRR